MSEKIQLVMGAAMTAVGVAGVLAPDRVSPPPGDAGTDLNAAYQTRLWTLRETALGLIMLRTRSSDRRRDILAATVALALAEAGAALASPALSPSSRRAAVGSAALFAGAGSYAWWSGRR
jgi:hypothetical protein